MARKKPSDLYKAKPTKFGNGARLMAFKTHINQEMVIMTRKKYKEFMQEMKAYAKNSKELSVGEFAKLDKEMAKKWNSIDDKATERTIQD